VRVVEYGGLRPLKSMETHEKKKKTDYSCRLKKKATIVRRVLSSSSAAGGYR